MDNKKHPWTVNPPLFSIKDIMNKKYQVIHPQDSFKTAIEIYRKYKVDIIPVVNESEELIGVFTKPRLFRALIDGVSLNDSCAPYIIDTPAYVNSELNYDTWTLVDRINDSIVGNVPVVDLRGKVVGIAGNREYLRTSLMQVYQSYALLESIFQAMNEGIITVDKDGYILRVNQSAEKMFGIHSPQIQGVNINEILPGIDYTGKRLLGARYTHGSLSVIVSRIPIMQRNSRVGTNLVFLDISDVEEISKELKSIQDLHLTLNQVLRASSDGVFVTDRYGAVQFVNDKAKQLVGGKNAKQLNESIADFLHRSNVAQVVQSGIAKVNVCPLKEKNCLVSHVPIKSEGAGDSQLVGVVSTVYLDDNKLTGEISRKWASLQQQVEYYRGELEKQGGSNRNTFDHIVTNNPEFIKIKTEAQRISKSSSTVLLTGESGVGKDMFARAIHAASPRATKRFVKVNCVAIPESLFESELFGYAPGSFTGALKKGKTGYFEQANEGTIFLDEIGDLPLSIQVKLLQVLQEKQFTPVGGEHIRKVNVRIIAATNRNLRDSIEKGTFREDLYYRLNVIELYLPPLRDRAEDIPSLAHAFIDKYNAILGSSITDMSQGAREAISNYSWPGNIRELENAIERAANYAWVGEIDIEHLPVHILRTIEDAKEPSSYRIALDEVVKGIIVEALEKAKGNKSEAARILQISRSTFYERLSKYGLN